MDNEIIDRRKVICYVLDSFPSPTETFIQNEIRLLSNYFTIVIYVLKRSSCQDRTLQNKIIYCPQLLSACNLQLCLLRFIKSPKFFIRILNSAIKQRGYRGIKTFCQSLFFSKQISLDRIKHIHSHFANYPTDVAILLSAMSGLNFSFSAHAYDIFTAPCDSILTKINKSEFVSVCHKFGKDHICRFIPEYLHRRIHVIYHGVDLKIWNNDYPEDIQAENMKLIAVGRLVEKKGFNLLIEAVKIVIKQLPDIRCDIVGEGPLRKKLQHKIKTLNLEKNINLTGWKNRAQLQKMFRSSSILLQPCTEGEDGDMDGIPNVILEAMAYGLPVISTPVSGIPEILNAYNSILTPSDNPKALADNICMLIKNKPLYDSIRNHAKKTIRLYDADQCIKPLIKLFERQFDHYL